MKTILIVDCNNWLRESYSRELSRRFRVMCETTSQAAIDTIDQVMPSAIILEPFSGVLNSFGLLHELQSHVDLSEIPVIIATSAPQRLRDVAIESYGIVEVLDKTVLAPGRLTRVVEAVVL